MTLPSSFSVENYRSFSRRQKIDIRPLTLFFGWNSGGKSALVRFLPLLAESVRIAGPPIWLAGEVGRGATWPELVCQATKRDVLRFAIQWPLPGLFDAEWDIKGDFDGRWQDVAHLSIANASGEQSVASDRWNGLFPEYAAIDDATGKRVFLLEQVFKEFVEHVQWISGIRVRPPRIATYGGGASPTLRPDGEDAVNHLIAAQNRSMSDPLLDQVQPFFHQLGEQLVLDSPAKGLWQVLLQPMNASTVRVNLCDTGEGYAQVLPVLMALARACTGGPRMLCLEQPELHLHTRAQAALAKVLVQSAVHSSSPRILVETHSEVLLMSVQLAIAKGEIPADDVRVYWVESRGDGTSDAAPVDFDAMGRPKDSTLVGAFEEAANLGRALVKIHLSKRNP